MNMATQYLRKIPSAERQILLKLFNVIHSDLKLYLKDKTRNRISFLYRALPALLERSIKLDQYEKQ